MFLYKHFLLMSCQTLKVFKHDFQSIRKRPYVIFVEGNIGSGKTTFMNYFKNNRNILVLNEPVNEWKNLNGFNLLHLMYEKPNKWGFIFQNHVQLTMAKLHELNPLRPVKMLERSLYSARFCFVENLYKDGVLPPAQVAVLDEWFKWLVSRKSMSCNLIVYLRTTPEVAYERIKKRKRPEEMNISLDYIKKLHEFHEEWLVFKTKFDCPAEVLVLNGNKDLEDMEGEYNMFEEKINSAMKNCCQAM